MKFIKQRKKRATLIHGNESKDQIMRSHFDPNGSYTGVPTSEGGTTEPVQDADDL